MSMSFAKIILPYVAFPYTYIFYRPFTTGVFLDAIKIAKIIPVHKDDIFFFTKNFISNNDNYSKSSTLNISCHKNAEVCKP